MKEVAVLRMLHPRRSGFTLLELIVVVVVLGVLAAIAAPTFDRVRSESRDRALESTAEAFIRNAAAIASSDGSGGVVSTPTMESALGEMGLPEVPTAGSISGVVEVGTATFTLDDRQVVVGLDGGALSAAAPSVAPFPFTWARSAGGTMPVYGDGLADDGADGAFVTGRFRGSAQFPHDGAPDTVLNSAGGSDLDRFIARMDADGSWAWATRFGSVSDDGFGRVVSDGSGGAIVVGDFRGSITFSGTSGADLTLASAGGSDAFVARIGSDGAWDWAARVGGTSSDYGKGVAPNGSGGAIVVGDFRGSATFSGASGPDLTLTSAGGSDAFVARIGADGVWDWAVRAGSTSSDSAPAAAPDGSGGAFVSARSTGWSVTLTFVGTDGSEVVSPTQSDGGYSSHGFTAHVDASGVWSWAVIGGCASSAHYCAAASDGAGGALLAGTLDRTTFTGSDGGSFTLTSAGYDDAFAARIDASGVWRWASAVGSTTSESGMSVASDGSGGAFVAGYTRSEPSLAYVGLPPPLPESARTPDRTDDMFVLRLDDSGSQVWRARPVGVLDDTANAVLPDGRGGILVAGSFNGTGDFGSSELTGSYDMFVARLSR